MAMETTTCCFSLTNVCFVTLRRYTESYVAHFRTLATGRALKQSLPQWSGQAGQGPEICSSTSSTYITYVCCMLEPCYVVLMSYYAVLPLSFFLETLGTFNHGNSRCLVECGVRSAASVDVAGTSVCFVCRTAGNPLGT